MPSPMPRRSLRRTRQRVSPPTWMLPSSRRVKTRKAVWIDIAKYMQLKKGQTIPEGVSVKSLRRENQKVSANGRHGFRLWHPESYIDNARRRGHERLQVKEGPG